MEQQQALKTLMNMAQTMMAHQQQGNNQDRGNDRFGGVSPWVNENQMDRNTPISPWNGEGQVGRNDNSLRSAWSNESPSPWANEGPRGNNTLRLPEKRHTPKGILGDRPIKEFVNRGGMNRNVDRKYNDKSNMGTEKSKKNYRPKIKPEVGPPTYDGKDYEHLRPELLECQICQKKMWNNISFVKHIRGKAHEEQLEKLVKDDEVLVSNLRKQIDVVESLSNSKTTDKCAMCDSKVKSIQEHRKSNYHQQLKKFLHPSCEVCGVDFEDRKDWYYHKYSGEHLDNLQRSGGRKKVGVLDLKLMKKLLRDLEDKCGVKGDVNKLFMTLKNKEDDSPKRKSQMIKDNLPKKKAKIVNDDDVVIVEDEDDGKYNPEQPSKDDSEKEVDPTLLGAEYVKSVEGFFCDLCKKFFLNGKSMAADHCNSITHKSKYNAAKEAAAADKLKEIGEKRTPAAKFFK